MLKIWGRRTSSNVQAVMWCVAELGLPHERYDIGHRFGGTDTDEFGAMNPNRTVPVLRDGDGAPIWETGAILRYLATQYGDDAFWPRDPGARAQVDKWAEWAKINLCMGFTVPIFWRVVRTAPQDRDQGAIDHAVTAFETRLALAEAQLAGSGFLAADHLTMADIQLGHLLYRYFDIDITRSDFPALRAYYDALQSRPAYRDHVMVSYDDLRVL